MKISRVLSFCAISATVLFGANNLVDKVKQNGMQAIPNSNYELLKLIDDPKDPITDAKVELGKKLYFDHVCQKVHSLAVTPVIT